MNAGMTMIVTCQRKTTLIFGRPKLVLFSAIQSEYVEMVAFTSNVLLRMTSRPIFSNEKTSIKHLVTFYNKVLLVNVNDAFRFISICYIIY